MKLVTILLEAGADLNAIMGVSTVQIDAPPTALAHKLSILLPICYD